MKPKPSIILKKNLELMVYLCRWWTRDEQVSEVPLDASQSRDTFHAGDAHDSSLGSQGQRVEERFQPR